MLQSWKKNQSFHRIHMRPQPTTYLPIIQELEVVNAPPVGNGGLHRQRASSQRPIMSLMIYYDVL
jgi:hypothetical protein